MCERAALIALIADPQPTRLRVRQIGTGADLEILLLAGEGARNQTRTKFMILHTLDTGVIPIMRMALLRRK